MAHRRTIYVSSTFDDLKTHRASLKVELERAGFDVESMERYAAFAEPPLNRCLADVAACDGYVLLLAHRYGFIPATPADQPQRSITHLEYEQARRCNKPVFTFVVDGDLPWPPKLVDEGEAAPRLAEFKEQVQTDHGRRLFTDPDNLTKQVLSALSSHRWNTPDEPGHPAPSLAVDWRDYREAIFERHQWVRLQVIAGASKDKTPLRIPLLEVFEPQMAASGVSSTHVPDAVRLYQREIYGRGTQGEQLAAASAEEGETDADEQDDIARPSRRGADEALMASNPEPVLKVLGRERTQVLLGGPGSGKSTIVHYALLQYTRPRGSGDVFGERAGVSLIPFLIELRDFVIQGQSDFVKYIVDRAESYYSAVIDVGSVEAVLRQDQRALVFFDGLDEVFDPDLRHRVIDRFRAFARKYPGAGIIVTSRIAGYDPIALGVAGFKHYTLLPLGLAQIRSFAQHWYRFYSLEGTERTADGLVRRIVESPRLLDLAGNPLLLTMMAVIYRDRDLPTERWRLYARCADTLLEDWDLNKGIGQAAFKLAVPIKNEQKAEILQRVSMYMLEHGQPGRELNAIAYAPLFDIMTGYIHEKWQLSRGSAESSAVDILQHLMERTYVLAGIGERVFGFVHRTFMEYFAAKRCQAQFNSRKSDFAWINRDVFGLHWQGGDWEEVLLLLIAMLHDQETPIHDVIDHLRFKSKSRTRLPFNLAFAARCLGEAGDLQDVPQGEAVLSELSEAIATQAVQFRKDKPRAFVEAALRGFAALAAVVPAPPSVLANIDALNSDGAIAVRMIAWQMGFALRTRDQRLTYAVAALQDKADVVRRAAIASLEREWPGRADIGPTLAAVVRDDRQAAVRQAALAALQRSWRQETATLDAIAARVEGEGGYRNAIQFIEYLSVSWIGSARARDLVIALGTPDRMPRKDYDRDSVVATAAIALAKGWAGDEPAFSYLQGRIVTESHTKVRAAAFDAIAKGWGGRAEVLGFLQRTATSDESVAIRSESFSAIASGWAGDAGAAKFVRDRAIHDPDPHARTAAFVVVAKGTGDSGDLEFLESVYAGRTDPKSRDALLHDLAAAARSSSWESMSRLDWRAESPALALLRKLAVGDPDATVRGAAIDSLCTLHGGMFLFSDVFGRNVSETLRTAARSDPDPEIRERATRALDAQDLPFRGYQLP